MKETLTVERAACPLDLLLFQRYRREVQGLVEQTLKGNPGLAALGAFLPIGTTVVVEIPAPTNRPSPKPIITLWTKAA